MQLHPNKSDEFAPHVDKAQICRRQFQVQMAVQCQANVASYDWSALLYLSEHGTDFQGWALLLLMLLAVAGQELRNRHAF